MFTQSTINRPTSTKAVVQGVSIDTEFFCPSRNALRLTIKLNQPTVCVNGLQEYAIFGTELEPPANQSFNAISRNTNSGGGVSLAQKFAVNGNHVIGSRVSHLLFSRSPSAVVWMISFSVVNAVKRVRHTWAFSHIGEKVRELLPSFANVNPAPAVIVPFGMRFASASINHIGPSRKRRRAFAPLARVSVLVGNGVFSSFASEASARFRVRKFVAVNKCFGTAITSASAFLFSVNRDALQKRQHIKTSTFRYFDISGHVQHPYSAR